MACKSHVRHCGEAQAQQRSAAALPLQIPSRILLCSHSGRGIVPSLAQNGRREVSMPALSQHQETCIARISPHATPREVELLKSSHLLRIDLSSKKATALPVHAFGSSKLLAIRCRNSSLNSNATSSSDTQLLLSQART
jgi:hypothetical protein